MKSEDRDNKGVKEECSGYEVYAREDQSIW